jgi:hypothetical protein
MAMPMHGTVISKNEHLRLSGFGLAVIGRENSAGGANGALVVVEGLIMLIANLPVFKMAAGHDPCN